jgi:hypothetical protein
MRKTSITLAMAIILLSVTLLVGYVKCIFKAIECNYEPIGKAEVVYVTGIFIPPFGAIVGYINIEDK